MCHRRARRPIRSREPPRRDEHSLRLDSPPDAGELVIRSSTTPAANVSLEGLYVSSNVFCTQCEPEGFRRITYFPDRPDVLSRYTVTLRADRDACPVLLSNGDRIGAGKLTRRPAFRDVARPVSQDRRTCSRWSPAISRRSKTRSRRSPDGGSR
jgi:hypothetical protein